MGKPAFTPGPWSADCDNTGCVYIFSDALAKDATEIAILNPANEECAANARLIAAAPSMYDALMRIIHDWDGEPDDMTEARAALAKAEGRT